MGFPGGMVSHDSRTIPAAQDSREARNALILFLLATLPYANTLFNSFVYDDVKQVLANPYIQNWRYLPEVFGSNVWSFLGAAGVTNHYRPMMTLTYLVCWRLFGPIPFGFHLVNLLFHAGVVWMLYRVTALLFPDRRVAFIAAGLFALHPIHTESVAWVAGITDLQLAFFYLLTFRFFLHSGTSDESPWKNQLKMGAAFFLALLSKEIAVTLPLLATLYEHGFRADRAGTTVRQKFGRYALLWMLTGLYLAFRLGLLGAIAPLPRRELPTWPETLLSAFSLFAQYVWKLIWPADLSAFYVFRKSQSFAEPGVLAGAVVILTLAGLFWFLWRHSRGAAFALLWFAAILAPVLNARWMAANAFAERYLYLPSAAFCWLVALLWVCGWSRASIPLGRNALVLALCAVGVLYAGRTVTRNSDWRDHETLYSRTLAQQPDAYLIRNNLGTLYWNRGETAAAVREWKTALAQQPDDVVLLNNLGLAAFHAGRYAEAEEFFRHAIRIRPAYPEPYVNLGRMYEQRARLGEAEQEYRIAIQQAPLHPGARIHLGRLLLATGRPSEAAEQFRTAARIIPSAEAMTGLGESLSGMGRLVEAESAYLEAIELDPYAVEPRLGIARIYRQTDRQQEAREAYEAVLTLAPGNQEAREALDALK